MAAADERAATAGAGGTDGKAATDGGADGRQPSCAPQADPELTAKVRDDAQATFKRVQLSLRMGHPDRALEALEPLLEKLDGLGEREPDSDPYSFDFAGPEQAYLYVAAHPDVPASAIHSTVAPYVDAYGIQAAILYQLGRYDEASDAIGKALRWNPTDGGLYLERAMAHAAASEYVLLDQDVEAAYPLITLAIDLARYHAFRADVLVSQGKYDLAAAHYAVYHDFDPDDTYALPDQELHELGHHTGHGHDYAELTSGEAQKRLKRAGEHYGPSDVAVAVMQQIVSDAMDLGDIDAAHEAARHLWETTRDRRWRDVCDKIDHLAESGKQAAEAVARERADGAGAGDADGGSDDGGDAGQPDAGEA